VTIARVVDIPHRTEDGPLGGESFGGQGIEGVGDEDESR